MRPVPLIVALGAATLALYSAETHKFTDAQKSFWSLQPVAKPSAPAVRNQQWVKNPIDAFVLAKLQEQNLQPNPVADKLTLLRRVTEDVTGLPATQEEIQQFLNDNSPSAYEKVWTACLLPQLMESDGAGTGSMLSAMPIAMV